MYINMMPDIKNDSNLGGDNSKDEESKDEDQNKVYEAMALSWGG